MTVPAENVVDLSNYATDIINSGLAELKRLFFCENVIDTAKFGLSLYCLTYIGILKFLSFGVIFIFMCILQVPGSTS